MYMLLADLEPIIYPPENVTIERIKRSLLPICSSDPSGTKKHTFAKMVSNHF